MVPWFRPWCNPLPHLISCKGIKRHSLSHSHARTPAPDSDEWTARAAKANPTLRFKTSFISRTCFPRIFPTKLQTQHVPPFKIQCRPIIFEILIQYVWERHITGAESCPPSCQNPVSVKFCYFDLKRERTVLNWIRYRLYYHPQGT